MSTVYFLRPGTGMQRIASREDGVDLGSLDALTSAYRVWRLRESELPEFGAGPASNRQKPRYVVLHVSAEEVTGRFYRAGIWLYESLQPAKCAELMAAETSHGAAA